MIWSFSGAKSFDRCQRQWYFKKKVAHHSAKEPLRREAYLLSKMDSLWSWRGKLVDQVIAHDLLPLLAARQEPSLPYLRERARLRFDRQREFALRHRIREPGCKPSSAGEEFAAFSAVERGMPPTQEELESAWSEVALALEHLLSMGDLLNGLRRADVLLGQRQINFKVENFDRESVTVQANPDLIALFRQAPPLIVDWKVHTFGSTDYRRQLSVYALALDRGYFAEKSQSQPFHATQIRLIEAQLLTGQQRHYQLDLDEIARAESWILESAQRIEWAFAEAKEPSDLPATTYESACAGCNFKSLCWREESWLGTKQMSLLF